MSQNKILSYNDFITAKTYCKLHLSKILFEKLDESDNGQNWILRKQYCESALNFLNAYGFNSLSEFIPLNQPLKEKLTISQEIGSQISSLELLISLNTNIISNSDKNSIFFGLISLGHYFNLPQSLQHNTLKSFAPIYILDNYKSNKTITDILNSTIETLSKIKLKKPEELKYQSCLIKKIFKLIPKSKYLDSSLEELTSHLLNYDLITEVKTHLKFFIDIHKRDMLEIDLFLKENNPHEAETILKKWGEEWDFSLEACIKIANYYILQNKLQKSESLIKNYLLDITNNLLPQELIFSEDIAKINDILIVLSTNYLFSKQQEKAIEIIKLIPVKDLQKLYLNNLSTLSNIESTKQKKQKTF